MVWAKRLLLYSFCPPLEKTQRALQLLHCEKAGQSLLRLYYGWLALSLHIKQQCKKKTVGSIGVTVVAPNTAPHEGLFTSSGLLSTQPGV